MIYFVELQVLVELLKKLIKSKVVLDKKIKIRFDANTSSDLSFNFKPAKNFDDIKIGEVNTIKFLVENQELNQKR